jgi:hypothetical protein
MLGRFLELALVTADTGAAWQRYQTLGFAAAETGDVWRHAYGVVACRGLAVGLHGRGSEPLSVVLVQSDVARLHRELADRDVITEQASLGSDVFNELAFRDPGGTLLRVVEARTFSPPAELPERCAAGRFVTLSLPCRDLQVAAKFWEKLGYRSEPRESPWAGFSIAGLPLACHTRRMLAEPALIFDSPSSDFDARLGELPLQQERALTLLDAEHWLLRTPEELALIVLR